VVIPAAPGGCALQAAADVRLRLGRTEFYALRYQGCDRALFGGPTPAPSTVQSPCPTLVLSNAESTLVYRDLAAMRSPQPTTLETAWWTVDWAASGIDGHAAPSFPDPIGTTLAFTPATPSEPATYRFDMGYGGGCMSVAHAYVAGDRALQLDLPESERRPDCYGSPGPYRVIDALAATAAYSISIEPCSTPAASGAAGTSCVRLRLFDARDGVVLVLQAL
jgi:hypothetical protein